MNKKKKIDISKVDDNLDLELIDVMIDHIVINPDKRVYVTLLDDEERQAGIELNPYEASILSFVHKELHKNSHIQTMHQLFVKSLDFSKSKIEEVAIESKVGDIIYCSLKIVDNNYNRIFTIVSIADGLILSEITKAPLKVISNVWKQMDEIDEWDYEDYIVDFDPDEE